MNIPYKKVLFTALVILTVTYPFAVYFGLNRFGPSVLSLVLFTLLLVRVTLGGKFREPEQYVQLILVGSLCLLAAWFESEQLLRYYPVLMNLGFSAFFAMSLNTDKSLIERFAILMSKDISNQARHYMRGLTKAWALLLLLNAVVAFYTACCLSLKFWTFYNGAVSYAIFGVFTIMELCYRRHYKKKYINS